MEYQVFPNVLSLLHCVLLYVCRLCINYQDLSTNLLGVAALPILLLTFISDFVIDFLSIRKVIIFSAIVTDGRYPLRSSYIHQNAANCMTIRFHYIAQPGGGGTDNLLRMLMQCAAECFKVATKFSILYFIMLNKIIRSA